MSQNLNKEDIAKKFGTSLDDDDFESFKILLDQECRYEIGDKIYDSPESISGLYESNMNEGRKKFDFLEWGKSEIKKVDENQFDVYFSDHLKHKGISHNYKCKQRIRINEKFKVSRIDHMELPGEKESLNAFYKKVGLK